MTPSLVTPLLCSDIQSGVRSFVSRALQKIECQLSIIHHLKSCILTTRSCTTRGSTIRAIRKFLEDLTKNVIHHINSEVIRLHVNERVNKYKLQALWSVTCIGEDINELSATRMNNQEDISNIYSVLYKEESWLNRSKLRKDQLESIKKLGFYGDSNSIHVLVKFLNHKSQDIRSATIKSIENLFNKLDTKSAYESSLRHCNILKKDIRNYIKYYSKEELKYPLALASINSNGYIREEALLKIQDKELSEELIQFVIYRLGDWVSEVRNAAQSNYDKVLSTGKWKSILEHIDLIFWLKKVQRIDLSNTFSKTIDFLTNENALDTYRKFPELNEKTRFKLCQEILKVNPIVELAQKTFIKDKSYLVRSKLAENIHRIDDSDKLISILQRDKSGLVRQKCLESIVKIDEERDKIDFRELLFDRSGTVRNLAKYYSKLSNEEVIDIYRNAIKNKNSIEVSICGLGELGRKNDVDIILPFVDSKQTKLKKAAIRTIMKFDSSLITNQIIEELDSKNKSIRKLAIECLSNTSDKRILNRCREISKAGTTELKISMLSFFGRNCTYKTLPDLILPLNDKLEEIRNSAWSHLDDWRLKSISNYSKQTEEDRKRAKEIYNQIKFKNRLPYAREKLWKELPYFGRFKDE